MRCFVLISVGIFAVLAGFVNVIATRGGEPSAQGAASARDILVPKDPTHLVLTWDNQRLDLPQNKEGPTLQVRADGGVAVTESHGSGGRVEARLSKAQLEELLRFVVAEQDIFGIAQDQLTSATGAAGQTESGPHTTLLRVSLEGRTSELHCTNLPGRAERGNDASIKRLYAIQQRLERLVAWAYAGGDAGVKSTLDAANAQLHRDFPDAPALREEDLRGAVQRIDGTEHVVLERRAIASDGNPYSFVYARVEKDSGAAEPRVTVRADLALASVAGEKEQKLNGPFNTTPTPVAQDKSVNWDYPIVYVRVPRDPANLPSFPNTHPPTVMTPGGELVVLHPDGKEDVLVSVDRAKESITDPFVSFDAEWVYFVKFYDSREKTNAPPAGSDIYKVHVKSRKVVQLTHQQGFTPNSGAVAAMANPKDAGKKQPPPFLNGRAVYNLGPCPVPGWKVVFTSDRNAFRPAPGGTGHPLAQQLFTMDDDGRNVENIGHMNLGGVLHPVILKDGRIIFTTNETQGLRGGYFFWGVWSMHPDGTNWDPIISAYDGDVFHFYSQLSDGNIVCGNYYPGGIGRGFGTFHKLPSRPPAGQPQAGPADTNDKRNQTVRTMGAMSFTPTGMQSLTLFSSKDDVRPNTALGNVTHPSGAPDNHLLLVWGTSSVPANSTEPLAGYGGPKPKDNFDAGIYLIKSGRPINEPGQMVLIKNDPKFHELWPRALVPYKRIYGIEEPPRLASPANDGKLTKHIPEGSPYGIVGSSSLYKRESYPLGVVLPGSVTASFGNADSESNPFRNLGGVYSHGQNWLHQGADAGLYDNSEIHAIRIVITEPVTSFDGEPRYFGHATNVQQIGPGRVPSERLRILGEFPVRKFDKDGRQPVDPDGNPDTSFEVKIPADIPWTFQTLDKRGLVLNMSQTWHQVRPGEVRNNCGGCHAHSQQPTDFNLTAAAKPDYTPWDLTGSKHPMLTTREKDETAHQWDAKSEAGVRFADGITNVEYFRDVKPIFERSCVACHTRKAEKPPAGLVLDDDEQQIQNIPGTYFRLALDVHAKFGHKPLEESWGGGGYTQATRYIRKMQARRSLLIWKVFGKRLDGWSNDDHPTETEPGNPNTLMFKGQPIPNNRQGIDRADLDFTGTAMPPPKAVAEGKAAPLSDEDRRTLARWVDLGCPLDLDFDAKNPKARGRGWLLDDNRPTLALSVPRAGVNPPLTRLLIGMHDYDSGLDMASFQVTADFKIDDAAPGENLAPKFKAKTDGVWELSLATPIADLPNGTLTIVIKDRQGNTTQLERTFSTTANAH